MSFGLLAGRMAEVKSIHDNSGNKMRFDPDKRLDIKDNQISLSESNASKFDPDKRINVSEKMISFWDNRAEYNPDKRVEVQKSGNENIEKREREYYTTYNERLERTPQEECSYGKWEGKRGESKFIPDKEDAKESLKKYDLNGIEYKEALPDFRECSEINVEIDMTQYRQSTIDKDSGKRIAGNFEKADAKCAERWNEIGKNGKNDWTARDVAEWRGENKYTWHECSDMKTCNLVPRAIHEECKHSGGVAECKRRDMVNAGGGFDE